VKSEGDIICRIELYAAYKCLVTSRVIHMCDMLWVIHMCDMLYAAYSLVTSRWRLITCLNSLVEMWHHLCHVNVMTCLVIETCYDSSARHMLSSRWRWPVMRYVIISLTHIEYLSRHASSSRPVMTRQRDLCYHLDDDDSLWDVLSSLMTRI